MAKGWHGYRRDHWYHRKHMQVAKTAQIWHSHCATLRHVGESPDPALARAVNHWRAPGSSIAHVSTGLGIASA
eukprot:488319-Rhodomonas_salina.11